MIILYGGGAIAFPNATQQGFIALMSTMKHAVDKWNREGQPKSGDFA